MGPTAWYPFVMRLRGLVFERFVTFERAEVNLCDERGVPLDVVLFVGESGAGKSSLLRGVAGLLSEAVGAGEELGEHDIRRTAESARCRVVIDDVVAPSSHGARPPESRDGSGRVILTLEKELTKGSSTSASVPLRALPAEAFDRWRRVIEQEPAPRAAFSIASGSDVADDGPEDDATDPRLDDGHDPLIDWIAGIRRGGPAWDSAVRAIDRVLWPYAFNHMTTDGELVFSSAAGLASSSELGDAFESVLVMVLELLRLTTARPNEELLYVIDDIDAHLHPRWQSRLIGDLRRAFPHVQLVATTRSPFVVASVEPYQVFRLETLGEVSGAGPRVVRVSDRIQKGATVSQVMDLAFGAPELPGPRWAHAPPPAVRHEVLAALDDDLTRGAVVYVLPEPVHVRDVRDAFGEAVLPGAEGGTGHLFFIDREPGIAWGHPCEYVFRARDGKLARQRAIWPPPNLERFVVVGRG
ncbi:MAG: hypothetical protein BGO98_48840 [Myxococcales bacterium 68-20]|nr:MAG: hypothetical protein BGO98_48840 [Myxococcales bacterium 68-20]